MKAGHSPRCAPRPSCWEDVSSGCVPSPTGLPTTSRPLLPRHTHLWPRPSPGCCAVICCFINFGFHVGRHTERLTARGHCAVRVGFTFRPTSNFSVFLGGQGEEGETVSLLTNFKKIFASEYPTTSFIALFPSANFCVKI